MRRQSSQLPYASWDTPHNAFKEASGQSPWHCACTTNLYHIRHQGASCKKRKAPAPWGHMKRTSNNAGFAGHRTMLFFLRQPSRRCTRGKKSLPKQLSPKAAEPFEDPLTFFCFYNNFKILDFPSHPIFVALRCHVTKCQEANSGRCQSVPITASCLCLPNTSRVPSPPL